MKEKRIAGNKLHSGRYKQEEIKTRDGPSLGALVLSKNTRA